MIYNSLETRKLQLLIFNLFVFDSLKAEQNRDFPNIVFILADDMGHGDPGCYNADSKIPTPNMDKLADGGIRFVDAHSPSAVCTPTRYGIMTGRYCWRSRLKRGVAGGYSLPLIEPSRLTIASMLKQKGYTTACIGKWHIGLQYHGKNGKLLTKEDFRNSNIRGRGGEIVDFSRPVVGGPKDLGFDFSYFNAACGTGQAPYGFIENDRFVDTVFHFYESKSTGIMGSGMMADGWLSKEADVIITKKACTFIEDNAEDDKPFYLYLTPNAPHEPCLDEYVPDFALRKSSAGARGDLVWLFDWVVGEIVKTLESTGQANNTFLIVSSDNGALPGDFIRDENNERVYEGNRNYLYEVYNHKSCGNLRGNKAHIWEGGHRIPFIAKWPGKVKAGTISDEVICLTDIMASCAAIVDYDLPDDTAEDSYNFLPVFENGSNIREATVHHSSYGVYSIRQGRWKLIVDSETSGGWPAPRGEAPKHGSPGQLYDLLEDPYEQVNLWETHQNIVVKLSNILEKYKKEGRSTLNH